MSERNSKQIFLNTSTSLSNGIEWGKKWKKNYIVNCVRIADVRVQKTKTPIQQEYISKDRSIFKFNICAADCLSAKAHSRLYRLLDCTHNLLSKLQSKTNKKQIKIQQQKLQKLQQQKKFIQNFFFSLKKSTTQFL